MGRVIRIGKLAALFVARGVWLSTLVILPLFGMWLASSLAAYHNATPWFALLVGLLLFPIVPVGWDLIFAWRMSRRAEHTPILTRVDRVVMRTLIVNLLFAGGLAWQRPVTVYQALSVRGDWMLDGHDGAAAGWMRARLFTIADWFRRGWTPGGGEHHYGKSDDAPTDAKPAPAPATPDATATPTTPVTAPSWPLPATVDPIVTAMPPEVQTSIASIGAYLAANIADPQRRVKAVHDVVVARLTYDHPAAALITAHRWREVPSMAADAVFARKSGVCEGYARLMVALGSAAGVEIAFVTGSARQPLDRRDADEAEARATLEGNGHAWNTARIGGVWYPIDATWDDSQDDYDTTYLFTPPALFILDHLPDEEGWQLLPHPKSVSDFLRQPAVSAHLTELGLVLRAPLRSQVSVSGALDLELDNPKRRHVMATVSPADAEPDDRDRTRECGDLTDEAAVRLRCDGLGDGEWRVDLWAGAADADSLDHVGSVWVNSR